MAIEVQTNTDGTTKYLATKDGYDLSQSQPGVPLYENFDGLIEADTAGGHQSNSSLGSAVSLSPPSSEYKKLLLQVFNQNIRVTFDGATTPTASSGFQFTPAEGMIALKVSSSVGSVQIIEESSGASIQYQWSR
jgi:hypothetical protein